jgi:hypothetical protein
LSKAAALRYKEAIADIKGENAMKFLAKDSYMTELIKDAEFMDHCFEFV